MTRAMAPGSGAANSSDKIRVRPSEIEGALDRIRRAADAADAKQAGSRQRATLSNLIVLTSQSAGTMRGAIDSLVQSLCVTHPSRFFIVEYDPAAGGGKKEGDERVNQFGVGTSVSSRCVLAESGAHICSEEVYLTVNEQGVKLASNLLLSLFVSGVEIVLLLLDDPMAAAPKGEAGHLRGFRELYEALRALSRTVVYDSASFRSYVESTNAVRGLSSDDRETLGASGASASGSTTVNKSGTRFRDISLYRTSRWRELIADGFDVERMQASLDAVSEVTISSIKLPLQDGAKANGAKVSGAATVLGSWIASCLGWVPQRAVNANSGRAVLCAGRARETVLRFVEIEGDSASADPIVSVEFAFDPAVYQGSMRLARTSDMGAIELTVMGCSTPTDASAHEASCDFYVRQVPGKLQPMEQLVLSGIVSQRQDQQSEEAIRLAARLADCLK